MSVAFEAFSAGQVIEGEPIPVTREAIVGFARQFDPQPFHLDEEAARGTFVGTLIASGWQTAGLGMRLLQRDVFRGGSSRGAPGIDRLRWLKPVRPGDTLRLSCRIEETRASASKPDRGFVRMAVTLLDGRDEAAMTQGFSVMLRRAGATPMPAPPIVLDTAPRALPESGDAVPMPFLSDVPIGATRDLGAHRFTADEIVAFAGDYDPQVFHLDARAAEATHFGALCASGWHTAAIWMRRLLATRERDRAVTASPVPQLGPSPGFDDMRWRKPVFVGDTLHYRSRLLDKRASASRPGWGLATHYNTAENQRGEPVFAFTASVFWQWSP